MAGLLTPMVSRKSGAAIMMFGLKRVVIVGANKIVKNIDEAEKRIELYAAPSITND